MQVQHTMAEVDNVEGNDTPIWSEMGADVEGTLRMFWGCPCLQAQMGRQVLAKRQVQWCNAHREG